MGAGAFWPVAASLVGRDVPTSRLSSLLATGQNALRHAIAEIEFGP
jgi:hypothetical protein